MRFLVAIDQSEFAELVVTMVQSLAHSSNDEVLLVHVAPRKPDLLGRQLTRQVIGSDVPEDLVEQAAALERHLSTVRSAGIQCQTLLVRGQPAPTIVQVAEEWSANMIVIGSHGRSMLYRSLLGSVSQEVLEARKLPVLVVPSPRPPSIG